MKTKSLLILFVTLAFYSSVQAQNKLPADILDLYQPSADLLNLIAAAQKGDADAQYNLGGIYQSGVGATSGGGHGVRQDSAEALKWFRKAAEQGDLRAQHSLGFMYSVGQGVPQNYVEAYRWYNLAAAQADKSAIQDRDILASHMTPSQIAQAQELSREFKPHKEISIEEFLDAPDQAPKPSSNVYDQFVAPKQAATLSDADVGLTPVVQSKHSATTIGFIPDAPQEPHTPFILTALVAISFYLMALATILILAKWLKFSGFNFLHKEIPLAATVVPAKRLKQRLGAQKSIILCGAVAFVVCGLIPPWENIANRNGEYGFHNSKPAGYSLIFTPPVNPETARNQDWFGVQIDFGRLLIEWAVLAAITGAAWGYHGLKGAQCSDPQPENREPASTKPANQSNATISTKKPDGFRYFGMNRKQIIGIAVTIGAPAVGIFMDNDSISHQEHPIAAIVGDMMPGLIIGGCLFLWGSRRKKDIANGNPKN
jgi:Sel1 repeat-containing protein